jgi:serine/threonine protein kinase
MNNDREEALFALALCKPAAKRAAWLDAECEGDATLRARIEARLAAHDKPEPLPPSDAPAVKATIKLNLAAAEDEAVGRTIGRYKVLEKVGEGGCGVVYVAEQTEPVRRRVALKVIKLGMDTKQVVARFEAERQALAMMDHPNIAKVLDAGATETGRPYFVMELVRGIKITEYCDQNNLTTTHRLDLFIKVCQAIQHAHQKGIIHRDIKPSNILVTLHDGVPVPKVIDFGIAKATVGQTLTDKTVYTQLQQFIGTPAYMSPEQAEMSGLDIDTRSDIYSLGVLLYELLAGSTPFDANELMSQGIDAMRKTIREKDPVRPSTRLSTLSGEELTTTAKRRSADTAKLLRQLRGDLDWIVMKCLEKDRTRRYETANGVAFDLKRHLNNEPVLARPPSAAYKFQKAFRRNKLAFVAGAAVAAALLLGIIASTWQSVRATHAEALALQSRGDAEKLSNFMLDDFYAQLEPSGQYQTVARLARQAVAYYDSLPVSLRTAETDRNSALAHARLALVIARQGDLKAALPLSEETAARLQEMLKQGDQSDGTIFALGLALEAQTLCYLNQGGEQNVLSLLKVVAILRPFATSTDGSRRVKLECANLLNLLSHVQPLEQGVNTCAEALRILEGLGALDMSDLSAASAWADIADSEAREAFGIGRLDDAERLEKQTLSLAEGVLAKRPGDLRAMQGLSWAPEMLGRIEATRFHEAAALPLETQSQQAAEDYLRFNPSDADGLGSLALADFSIAALLFRQGRVAEALQEARASVRTLADRGDTGQYMPEAVFWEAIVRWEAQRENRGAGDQALQEGRHSIDAYAARKRMPEIIRECWVEAFDSAERQMRLAFREDATVYTMASHSLPQLEKLRRNVTDPAMEDELLLLQRQTLDDAAQAALSLGRFADAESAGRMLLSPPSRTGVYSERYMDQPDDPVRGQVLLAHAAVGQGRKDEALKMLEPALAHYRETQAQGAAYIAFRQHFARALYVQALAEPGDNGGIARRREALDQATALLQGLSDEARQLHDSKQLASWITAAQKKLNPAAEQKN